MVVVVNVWFPYSDLMMRYNLFEVVTSSRTFYIQVRSSSWTLLLSNVNMIS